MTVCRTLAGLVAAAVPMSGAAQAADFTRCQAVAYVALAKDGTLRVNGAPTDLSLLSDTVARTTARFVFYYREDGAKTQAVTDAVMRLRRPLSMSSKPDFSDTVDAQGVSRPRTACPEQG